MSLQLALSSALSGLRASQQRAALLSHNLSNATTPGFVRKDLEVSTAITSGRGNGVRIDGIGRRVDELLIRDARFEGSRYTAQETRASALADYAVILGQPQDERSVSTAVAKLQQAFETLHGMPANDAAQAAVVDKANALVQSLHQAAAAASAVQADARDRLAVSVDGVNAALSRISTLNGTIAVQKATGGDMSDLLDERDRLLDQVSQEIGIRTYTRDSGEVVVMTRNGQMLLDHELEPGEKPLQLLGNDLRVDGVSISANPDRDVQSGRIMGLLQTAEQDMPRALSQLDALAVSLIQRFQNAEANTAAPGLFTNAGSAYSGSVFPPPAPPPPAEPPAPGDFASRIAVNGALDGNAWRVQSGVQAAAPLEPGDQTQINRYLVAFENTAGAFTADDLPGTATLGGYATALVSTQQGYRTNAEAEMATRKISANALESARINHDGVNIDDEMQKLLLIEQSYGASAQVIQAAGRMLDTLLQIGN